MTASPATGIDPWRLGALGCLFTGLLLVVVAPFLPGPERLVPRDPPRQGHVTALTTTDQGLLAGTERGELWRHREGAWNLAGQDAAERAITVLRGDPAIIPAGTAAGLLGEVTHPVPDSPRISDVLSYRGGVLVATGTGVLRLAQEGWAEVGPDAQVYRLGLQQRGGETRLHAGTIGEGLYTADPADTPQWRPNRRGLPSPVNVLSLATTPGGLLLAGTDQGLYWQAETGDDWRQIDAGLGARRILALRLGPPADGTRQLWLGSDDGLLVLDLVERSNSLESRGRARQFGVVGESPRSGVSWIALDNGRPVVSAGAVYALEPTRFFYWHWVGMAGVVLVLVGLRLWGRLRR